MPSTGSPICLKSTRRHSRASHGIRGGHLFRPGTDDALPDHLVEVGPALPAAHATRSVSAALISARCAPDLIAKHYQSAIDNQKDQA